MFKESNYCSDAMKEHLNKEVVMTRKDGGTFENSTKYFTCDNGHVDGDVKVRDHFHITGKYRGPAHRDCKIKVKLNHRIPIIFRNLRNYDSHLISKN